MLGVSKLTEADSFWRSGKRMDWGQGGIKELVVSFALEMEGFIEGLEFMFSLYCCHGGTRVNGVIQGKRDR